jgi:trehalose 6-phosphate synthase/phosphatase
MRLLIVSNRLSVTVSEKGGQLSFKESVGGLASGLSAYLDSLKGAAFTKSDHVWIGWPGISAGGATRQAIIQKLEEFQAHPVFLSERAMDKFYLGFCNRTIWPLFHYFPSYAVYDDEYWTQYERVNQTFCDAVMEIARPDDLIWIHDYHLMLLPKLLRARLPNAPIGFFLHIPFPDFEIFRLLPRRWRRDILDGLLGADLIGFHTHDYTQCFLRCVVRILGYDHNMGQIVVGGRLAKADTFPMGIDFDKYFGAASSPEIQPEKAKLAKTLADTRVVVSIDRLDYTKGVINRLLGYEVFLAKNPEWHEKVTLSLVVVPSRVGVEHYRQTKRQIDELVGKINGRFGKIGWTPILYQYGYLSLLPLVALYASSDVAMVTPLRDGMNLVAKEYIASRVDQTGVLILSEMVGSAKELTEAIIINPNNVDEIADALKEGLEMPREEQVQRNRAMQARLKQYNVVRWAEEFIQALFSLKAKQNEFNARYLGATLREKLKGDFNQARNRLMLLDYDGTLTPLVDQPQMARPSQELVEILTRFAQDSQNQVVIISGRDRETLDKWFGSLGIGLIAEHGVWTKNGGADWAMVRSLMSDWKPQIRPLLELYADRLPGAFVEEKEFSIVWHYRRADPELGAARAKELVDDLVNFTANNDIQVLQGSKVVEVRQAGVNKGSAALSLISASHADFILAAGDDWTDEDLFKVLPADACSIKIGMSPSYAKFNLRGPNEMVELLAELSMDVAERDKPGGALYG